MNAALLTLLGVFGAALLGMVQVQLNRINDRLDKIIDRLSAVESELRVVGQRLDDHIVHHPPAGATR